MSAARAVETEFKAQGHEATTVDVLDHTGKGFRTWYRGGYEVLVKKRPKVWGHLYRTSDRKLFNYWVQTGLDSVFVSRMRKLLVRERPDWVVCTHSLPQPVLARWRKRLGFRVAIVVTDLYPQLMWLRGRPDWFFVPGDWSRDILERRFPGSHGRITVTGIPVDRRFGAEVDAREARQRLGLDPLAPTVLVTSGGIGGGPIGAVVSALRAQGETQFVVVCGRSHEALKAATEASAGATNMFVKGHVDTGEMADLMHSADLIVAKPGGITTFESMAAGLPFVVYDPFLIPGQEEKNAEFLVESGIGERVGAAAELARSVAALLASPDRRSAMRASALSHAKPRAAEEIVATLLRL